MSELLDPSGKKIIINKPVIEYKGGGLQFSSQANAADMLHASLGKAQNAVGMRAAQAVAAQGGGVPEQQSAGQTAASQVQDPFSMEPAALAVFMAFSTEIDVLRKALDECNSRFVELGVEPVKVPQIDLKAMAKKSAQETKVEVKDTGSEEDA